MDNVSIAYDLPSPLNEVVLPWVSQGHYIQCNGSQPLLFFTKKCKPLSSTQLWHTWNELEAEHGAKYKPRLSPNDLRTVFVTARKQDDSNAAPNIEGSARIMGNTPRRCVLA
jgi:hypothetical protein